MLIHQKPICHSGHDGLPKAILTRLLLLLLTSTTFATAFQCFVCDSKTNNDCTENFLPNSRLTPQDCGNITGAKYCIKTTNLYGGELGTKRFCSSNDHGSYCKYVRQPTGDREYRSCVLTCDSENCNSSKGLYEITSVYHFWATPLTMITAAFMTVEGLTNNPIVFRASWLS